MRLGSEVLASMDGGPVRQSTGPPPSGLHEFCQRHLHEPRDRQVREYGGRGRGLASATTPSGAAGRGSYAAHKRRFTCWCMLILRAWKLLSKLTSPLSQRIAAQANILIASFQWFCGSAAKAQQTAAKPVGAKSIVNSSLGKEWAAKIFAG